MGAIPPPVEICHCPRLGERHYVNFASSGFIRLVGRPFSAGDRFRRSRSPEFGRQEKVAVSECRERPDSRFPSLIATLS